MVTLNKTQTICRKKDVQLHLIYVVFHTSKAEPVFTQREE